MPVARIQLPDGRIGRFELPEGTTPEQALELAIQAAPKAEVSPPPLEKEMGRPGAIDSVPKPSNPIIEGIVKPFAELPDKLGKRVRKMETITAGTGGYGESLPEAGFQRLTNVVGGIGDVAIGAPIQAALNTGYNILPEGGQENVRKVGEFIAPAVEAVGEGWKKVKTNYPRAAANLEGVGDVADFLPLGSSTVRRGVGNALSNAADAGVSVGKATVTTPLNIVKKVGQGAAEVGREALGVDKPIVVPTIKEVGQIRKGVYDTAKQEGAFLPGEFMTSFTDQAKKDIIPEGSFEQELLGNTPAIQALTIFDKYKTEPLDMDRIDNIDKLLTRKANESWRDNRPTADTADILEIQSMFRDAIKDSSPQKGIESWQAAKSAFSVEKQLHDINNIREHAKRMPNEATALQAGARTLVENPRRFRGFNPEVQQYLLKMASDQTSVDVLKTLSSRIITAIAAGSGAPGAAAASMVGGAVGRNLAARVKLRQADKADKAIVKGLKSPDKNKAISSRKSESSSIDDQLPAEWSQ